jgi:hypothetical protein
MKEQDIRPQELQERYLELSKDDAVQCFANEAQQPMPFVACGSFNHEEQFEKAVFLMDNVETVGPFSKHPGPPQAFEAFYHNSSSSNYWAEVVSQQSLRHDEKNIQTKSRTTSSIVYGQWQKDRSTY